MARKSTGRGAVAALGFFLLFAGIVGGVVLYVVSQQRPGQAVDGFARAPVGCTTTLEFSEIGDFYVFEEVGPAESVGGCQPVADPSAAFSVAFEGDLAPTRVVPDDSVSYDVDGFDGRSIERITIDEPGRYTVAVQGDDLTVLAAIGRDPAEDVDDLRRNALVVALIGVVLGLLLLVVSGRGSKKAAIIAPPTGPGWGPARPEDGVWDREPIRTDQVPVNPHEPTAPARAELPSRPLSDLDRPAPVWAPPSGAADAELPAPDSSSESSSESSSGPEDEPVLPDTPGRTSGT